MTDDPCGPEPTSWTARVPGTKAWKRRRHVLLCIETFRKVQQIVDGEMPKGHDTDALLAHLEECGHCGAEAEAVRQLKLAVERVECGCADEIAQRLRPALDRLLAEDA